MSRNGEKRIIQAFQGVSRFLPTQEPYGVGNGDRADGIFQHRAFPVFLEVVNGDKAENYSVKGHLRKAALLAPRLQEESASLWMLIFSEVLTTDYTHMRACRNWEADIRALCENHANVRVSAMALNLSQADERRLLRKEANRILRELRS